MGRQAKLVKAQTVASWERESPKSAMACGDGLYFRASAGGKSQWSFRYMLNGRARWLSIGHYPDKSLAQARDDARRLRVAVRDGCDVAEDQRQERLRAVQASTVAELAGEWFSHQIEPRYLHPEVVERRLRLHVIPIIGKLHLDEISPMDVDKVLRKLRVKYPATANDVLRDLKNMFKFAAKRMLMVTNPAANFDISDAGGEELPRERALEAKELESLFLAMSQSPRFGRVNTISVQLLLALCVRKMELLAAKWEEFELDDGVWLMPDGEGEGGSKSSRRKKRAVAIPLSPVVVDWLRELKVFSAGSEWVFPARRVTKQRRFPHVSPDTLNWAMKQALDLGLEAFTVHDLRRTARSHLGRLGVPENIAERALNHKIRGVKGVYDRYEYFPERQEALNIWSAELVALGAK